MKLLPHQIEDAAFLAARKFAGNFSGMGSGKTLTGAEACRLVMDEDDKAIVVGPPISLTMWAENLEEHTSRIAQVVKTSKMKLDPSATFYVLSYQIAVSRVAELKRLGAKVLICDESHALKSVGAKRTKMLLGRKNHTDGKGLVDCVDHAWMLTGTPQTRWNDDLYSFLVRANPQALKEKAGGCGLDRFMLRYCITQRKTFSARQRVPTTVVVGNRNTDELREMMYGGDNPVAVRRELKEVWAQMPPLTVSHLTVRLDTDAQLKADLKALEKRTMADIQQAVARKDENLAAMRRRLGAAKVKFAAEEIIDRLQAGTGPYFVGVWHRDVIDGLMQALSGYRVAVIDGRTKGKDRDEAQDKFNSGKLDILIGQIAACGTSLNLQGGGHKIIEIEQDWSPSIMDQFRARLLRLGQQADHVHVDVFQSDTKLDRAVSRTSATKAREHERVNRQETSQ